MDKFEQRARHAGNERRNRRLRKLFLAVGVAYFISIGVMGMYYQSDPANDGSVVGELIVDLKAFAWPYFYFVGDELQREAKAKADQIKIVDDVSKLLDEMSGTLSVCLLYTSPSPRDS